MSLIKQTVCIAKANKQNELKKALFSHLLSVKQIDGCINYEVYEADEDDTELLVYEEWRDDESYTNYKNSEFFKEFNTHRKEFLKREEVLPNF
ncbi:putative quinol monooxygenase [Arcobacter sp. CECT 8985]|uniref:putative quinol monooxygenase n=1 Tax=Arcobacter sp. CECT 8985 TaxID=1935424 RepID=UPI00100A28A9|nr:antibiotic biosynthesis monooxygenase family protein [Arcobacter sp. CECT 8985]RXJ86694.1 hypothetical protein CRU93_07720 [Arcobacter sp. CECT 8985]